MRCWLGRSPGPAKRHPHHRALMITESFGGHSTAPITLRDHEKRHWLRVTPGPPPTRRLPTRPPERSVHGRSGLGECPAVALQVIGDIGAVAVLMDVLDDGRPARLRPGEMAVEVIHEYPRHVRAGGALRPVACQPGDDQRAVSHP